MFNYLVTVNENRKKLRVWFVMNMAIHHYANNPSNATHVAIFFALAGFIIRSRKFWNAMEPRLTNVESRDHVFPSMLWKGRLSH
jgi:hypothetical protein